MRRGTVEPLVPRPASQRPLPQRLKLKPRRSPDVALRVGGAGGGAGRHALEDAHKGAGGAAALAAAGR